MKRLSAFWCEPDSSGRAAMLIVFLLLSVLAGVPRGYKILLYGTTAVRTYELRVPAGYE